MTKQEISDLNIAKNNAFKKLSKAKKRVQIAKDVLEQLKCNKLIAQTGVYVSSNMLCSLERQLTLETLQSTELKDLLDKEQACTVCGIGSLFVCAVKRMDKLKIKDLTVVRNWPLETNYFDGIGRDHISSYLKDYFSAFELSKIESAFERLVLITNRENEPHSSMQIKEIQKAYKYFNSASGEMLSAQKRMEIIMKNIIKNNGEFKVPQRPYH